MRSYALDNVLQRLLGSDISLRRHPGDAREAVQFFGSLLQLFQFLLQLSLGLAASCGILFPHQVLAHIANTPEYRGQAMLATLDPLLLSGIIGENERGCDATVTPHRTDTDSKPTLSFLGDRSGVFAL